MVFWITGAVAVGFEVLGIVSTPGLASAAGSTQSWVITDVGWFFVLSTSFFVIWLGRSAPVLVMGVPCLSLYEDLQTDVVAVRDRLGTGGGKRGAHREEHEGQFALVVEKSEDGEPVQLEDAPSRDEG